MKNNIPITSTRKKSIINKIKASRAFQSSETCRDLLEYLVTCNLKDGPPKELTIAIDFFDKGADFNPAEQTTVRYHVYKLRQRLKKYYETEGREDEIRLRIPKGHYAVEFFPVHTARAKSGHSRFFRLWIGGAVLVMLVLIGIILFLLQRPTVKNPIPRNNWFWSLFFNNDFPCSIVFGDFYIFEEYDPELGYHRRVMDYYMHTDSAFHAYQRRFPERENRELDLGELPHNSVRIFKDLLHVFYSTNKNFDLHYTTQLSLDDIKDHNIIFSGSFMNMRLIQDLIEIIPVHVHPITKPLRRLTVFTQERDTLKHFETDTFWSENGYIRDYGLLALLPGLNDEIYMVIAGYGYASKIELVKMVCSPERLEQFENMLKGHSPVVPEHFVVLFEFAGYQRTGYSMEIKHFQAIEPEQFKQRFRQRLLDISSGD